MAKVNRVTVTRKIGENEQEFVFKASSSDEATVKLDELLGNGSVDLDVLKEQLSGYIFKASTGESKKKPTIVVDNTTNVGPGSGGVSPGDKSTRGRGDSNDLRLQMITFFQEELNKGAAKTDIIKAAMVKFDKTYANTYYYYERVMNGADAKKAKKKAA